MYVTDSIRIFYLIYFLLVCFFFIWFITKVKKPVITQSLVEEKKTGMDKRELRFFLIIIVIVIIAHVITFSNIVPWQKWRLWSKPMIVKTYDIKVSDYKFEFPEEPMIIQKGQFIKFVKWHS